LDVAIAKSLKKCKIKQDLVRKENGLKTTAVSRKKQAIKKGQLKGQW
jgi:hypothetical protein